MSMITFTHKPDAKTVLYVWAEVERYQPDPIFDFEQGEETVANITEVQYRVTDGGWQSLPAWADLTIPMRRMLEDEAIIAYQEQEKAAHV